MKLLKRIAICLIASMFIISAFGCVPTQKPNDADVTPDVGNTGAEAMSDITKSTPTSEPTGDPREVQYVIETCQLDPDYFEVKPDLPTFTYDQLMANAKECIKRCLEVDDVTDMIPLYSYENVLSLNFMSNEEKARKGVGEHIAYIIYDVTWPYVYNNRYAKLLDEFYLYMPDAAIKYDAEANAGYIMYDLDNGMRLYYMLKDMKGLRERDDKAPEEKYLNLNILGNPAVMAKRTAFAEFDGVLKNGATITELADVDPAFNAYIDYMQKGFFYTYLDTKYADDEGNIKEGAQERFISSNIRMNRPVSSVLILTDGVLKIFWDYDGNDYVVDRYEFREDFIMESFGIEVSYKIEDRYYVG